MANSFCDKIWRMSIGHYGGKYVEVPREHLPSFKQKFPKRQWPRRYAKRKVIQDMGFGVEFEDRFHREYPKSGGVYYDLFFDDRSKGLKTFENLLDKHRCYRYPKWKNR